MAVIGSFYCNTKRNAREWIKLYHENECAAEIHVEYALEDLVPKDLQEDKTLIPKLSGLQCKIISDHKLEVASAYGTYWVNHLQKAITIKNIYTIYANQLFYVQIWYENKLDKKCQCHPDGSSDTTVHNVLYL